jgi:hypothetical protein
VVDVVLVMHLVVVFVVDVVIVFVVDVVIVFVVDVVVFVVDVVIVFVATGKLPARARTIPDAWGWDPVEAGPRAAAPETNPVWPGLDPVAVGIDLVEAAIDPVVLGGGPVKPGGRPVVPGVDPVVWGGAPGVAGSTPVAPGIDPVAPGVDPVAPRIDPATPAVAPITPGTRSVGSGIDPLPSPHAHTRMGATSTQTPTGASSRCHLSRGRLPPTPLASLASEGASVEHEQLAHGRCRPSTLRSSRLTRAAGSAVGVCSRRRTGLWLVVGESTSGPTPGSA